MKYNLAAVVLTLVICPGTQASIIPCVTATLPTYLNAGAPYDCTLASGTIKIGFHENILPGYAGLDLLTNDSADPASITVTPSSSSLSFLGTFNESGVLASQAELVQFLVSTTTPNTDLQDTTFSLNNPSTGTGGLGLGTGVVIGQELICVGGSFTSLPTGLITSLANGVLGTDVFGCNGVALIGTVGDSSGPLSAITGVLGLPSLVGVQDSVTIQLSPYNTNLIDVIKIQALLTAVGGTASTQGFGDGFSTFQTATPEPNAGFLLFGGVGVALAFARKRRIMSPRS